MEFLSDACSTVLHGLRPLHLSCLTRQQGKGAGKEGDGEVERVRKQDAELCPGGFRGSLLGNIAATKWKPQSRYLHSAGISGPGPFLLYAGW